MIQSNPSQVELNLKHYVAYPVAMWHVRAEISPAILLVVDFGGWYMVDSEASDVNSSEVIQHTQVSLLKDVIIPYTHLLPRLHLSQDRDRQTLLYFKGAKHRHRGGLVREKLWDLLANEPGVVMEEGFLNATGREQSIKGLRGSQFCLHPAGDTPTSCRLFGAILSLCIPVIVSDNIELPFEGMVWFERSWEDLLANEPGVVMEEGFPNATGCEQSIKGMRGSQFCLHPAGDTPTSCQLFDAILSLCIPVIVSDSIELPFEGMVDYSDFSVFISVNKALQPNWLISHLRSISKEQKDRFRRNLAGVQPIFEYDNGHPGGIGPIPTDGAVNLIWRKVHQKVPAIKESIIREKRKPDGASAPVRCHCT